MFLFIDFSSPFLTIVKTAIAVFLAILIAVPFHEFAHAMVAKHEGDFTASAQKRCTLAPFSHFDKLGFICLFLFGLGWANPVPVDSRNFKRGKFSGFLVSIAGVLTNFLLAIFFIIVYMLIYKFAPNFYSGTLGDFYFLFFTASISINLSLCFFNLLPIYPLDGHRILSGLLGEKNIIVVLLQRFSILLYVFIVCSGFFSVYMSSVINSIVNFVINILVIFLGL